MNPLAPRTLLLGLLLCPVAQAASSVELRVTGIIKPGACEPSLSGSIDYGVLPSDWTTLDLRASTSASKNPAATAATAASPQKYTRMNADTRTLESRKVVLTINCTAPMPVAIVVRDNLAASKMHGLAQKSGAKGAIEASMYGLDATSDIKHGAFHLAMTSASAGGVAVDIIRAPMSDSARWSAAYGGAVASDQLLSWAPAGKLTPGTWTSITGTLEVTPVLQGELDRSQDIKLNGSATIEVRYL